MKISDIFRIRDDAQFQINTECAAGGFRPPLISPAIVRIVLENSGAPLLLAELERIVEMDTGELGHEYETDWKIARAAISAARVRKTDVGKEN